MRQVYLVTLLATLFACAVIAQPPDLSAAEIASLIRDARENGRGFDRLRDYTYIRRAGKQRTLGNGQIKDESTTYEIFYLLPDFQRNRLGYSHIKTHENGVPLPPENIEKERKRIIEDAVETYARLSQAEQAQPAQSKLSGVYFGVSVNRNTKGLSPEPLVSFDIPSILTNCEFRNARYERIGDRPTIILDWLLKPAAELSDEHEFLTRMTGVIWIDLKDRIVIKAEAFPKDQTARLSTPAASFEAMRLSDGFWVTRASRLNGEVYPKLFGGRVTDNYYHETTDYKRFNSEIKDARIGRPPGER